MKLTIDISGSKKIQKRFAQFAKEGEEITAKLLKTKSQEITAEAKRNAPVDKGTLRKLIINDKITPLKYVIESRAPYSAYMEFGTGKKVEVPDEFSSIASKFKGGDSGSFDEGLERIKLWCKSHGIDEKYAYPIFMSILNEGLEPHPFMYPALLYGRLTYRKDLKFVFDKLIKKYNNE